MGSRFGCGIYFATSASKHLGCALGSHRLFLCEVALGRPMLAQSARPNLDADALERAGFDSLHVPRGTAAGECEEWVVYNAAQALPTYLLSYDVQPKLVAAQLLKEMVSLEDQ